MNFCTPNTFFSMRGLASRRTPSGVEGSSMPQISTVVRILDLHNRVGALGNPPPNPQADALVLAYLNGPPHNFGVQQVQLQTGGVLAGTVKVLITVAQIPPNQKIIFDALK